MQAEEPQADYNGKPQVEDGFTRIANELLEAIYCFDFSKRQLRILLCILRKTYGFNKKQDDMTVTQLANDTGLDRASVSKSLDELVLMQAVTKRHGRFGYVLEINKHYRQWRGVTKHHDRDKTSIRVCQNVTEGVTKRHTQKTTPKDNTKDICANDFAQFWKAYPKKKSKGTAEKAWAKIKPNEQQVSAILAAIEQAKTSVDWQKQNGQFIPYPATWLNAKGWEDEGLRPLQETPEEFARRMTA